MSKKAEERALECYPVYEFLSKDINRRDRNIFLQGYQVAEKDLALTWQDMRKISMILDKMIDEDVQGELVVGEGDEAYYSELLKRFNEEWNV